MYVVSASTPKQDWDFGKGRVKSPKLLILSYGVYLVIFVNKHCIETLNWPNCVIWLKPTLLTTKLFHPMALTGVTNAHGLSPMPTAYRSPTCSLTTATSRSDNFTLEMYCGFIYKYQTYYDDCTCPIWWDHMRCVIQFCQQKFKWNWSPYVFLK